MSLPHVGQLEHPIPASVQHLYVPPSSSHIDCLQHVSEGQAPWSKASQIWLDDTMENSNTNKHSNVATNVERFFIFKYQCKL